jgi:hypothetical protein
VGDIYLDMTASLTVSSNCDYVTVPFVVSSIGMMALTLRQEDGTKVEMGTCTWQIGDQ